MDGNGGDNITSDETPYDKKTVKILQVVYILAILIWIFLIFKLKLHHTNTWGNLIVILPLLIYFIAFWNLDELTIETEGKVFALNYISVSLVVFIPILTWCHENFHIKQHLIDIMILAIVLAVLSLLDVWVTPKWISITRHLRSILQVASLTLIVYVLYELYKDSPHPPKKHHNTQFAKTF
jgi:hypothetical protein